MGTNPTPTRWRARRLAGLVAIVAAAMQELALHPAGAPDAATVPMAAPGQLTVSTERYTLAAERIGPVPVLPTPRPTTVRSTIN